jgi:hypothetical protein
VISALAGALQVSIDTLLLRAAGVAAGDATERSAATEDAIRQDPRLDDAQKHALLAVLSSFVGPSPSRSKPTPVHNGATPAVTRAPRRRQPPKAPARDREVHDNA